ncbi:MAG TPA: HAMP domain-containing sensor histidine kinase [Candidatus Limnocylindrales bacterium]
MDRVATLDRDHLPPVTGLDAPAAQLGQLQFLYRIIRLATTAGTWDELLETVVDGTRDALEADVSSLYLLDRDGEGLTLAATNGLDRFQIGRAKVPFGEGVTGRVAASREPRIILDVPADPHFLWVRGIDQRRFIASMLSVPLIWHDTVVGVLNVQTEQARDFTPQDADQLRAIADLLAGIVERVRLQREAEDRVDQLRALDQGRVELIALVTHELRTPLAVVRAYADLLAEEPELEGRGSRDPGRRAARAAWHDAAVAQIERIDRLVDSIIASVRPEGRAEPPPDNRPIDVQSIVADVLLELAPLLRHHVVATQADARRHVYADEGRLRQVVEHLVENAVKYAPPGSTISIETSLHEGVVRLAVEDDGPGVPDDWRERIFEPYARRETRTARGSGIGLYAARRLCQSMGARLWCEPGRSGGARFVVAMPAAVAI